MTLKKKLCMITLLCTLATMSLCLSLYCAWQAEEIRTHAETRAQDSLKLFCANLESLDRTVPYPDPLTGRSITQYYFATYSHILGGGSFYSLVQEDEYLYNACPYNPKALLKLSENEKEACETFEIDGHRMVIARPVRVLSEDYIVYLCEDVSEAYEQAAEIRLAAIWMVLLSALAVLLSVVFLVKRALRPLERLRVTADAIAGGEYALRAQVQSTGEVAALAKAFNHMADAVEGRMRELTEESEKRKLLLGALAHEIKTPMTAIIGFADSLMRMPLTEEQKVHCAQQILLSGQHTERMAQKLVLLLALDGENTLNPQRFSAIDFADELSSLYPGRLQIRRYTDELTGDRDLLLSMMQNLVGNALHASAPSQNVEVTLAAHTMSVADHGCGIAPEHLSRLTEPFYRADKDRSRKHGGAGLGLALCKAIAVAHGGSLTIESKLGIGTTVTALLPSE